LKTTRNTRFSGAHRVPDITEAAAYYREEHRKVEESGFKFEQEDSHNVEEKRLFSRGEKSLNSLEPKATGEVLKPASKNVHFSGAHKIPDISLAGEHYSEYMREFRSMYDIERIEEHLDLQALAREGEQSIERTEEDISRRLSVDLNGEKISVEKMKSLEHSSLIACEKEIHQMTHDFDKEKSVPGQQEKGLLNDIRNETKKGSDTLEHSIRSVESDFMRRKSASRRSGAHRIQKKDAARDHYLSYVRQYEQGYT
jgi:hypothetical protein